MSEATITVELTIEQIGMVQRALRQAAISARVNGQDVLDLDIEHLRTLIAESVSMSSQSEQSGHGTSTP